MIRVCICIVWVHYSKSALHKFQKNLLIFNEASDIFVTAWIVRKKNLQKSREDKAHNHLSYTAIFI